MDSLRVLMVDSEESWRGGEAQMRLLMSGLCDEGVEVHLAAPRDSEIQRRTARLPVQFHALRISGGLDLGAGRRLRAIMRGGRFDIVHSHSSHAHGVVFMATSMMRRPPRHVVSRRVDFAVGTNALSALKYRRGADLYLAVSNGVREVLIEGGVDPGHIRLVHDGIDLGRFAGARDPGYLRDEFGLDAGTRVVGNVAALAPHKSQVDLLRAAERICAERSDVRFFIVGEGPLEKRLKGLTTELGLDGRVVFTGFREDVLELLSLFDVFVMSSYLEGLGTSILDAQAAGVPVVATRTGGIVDVVEDGVSGLLVPPRSPDRLASAITRMLDDNSLAEQCVMVARERVKGYDHHAMVYKTLDAYRELADSRPAPESPVKGPAE